MTEAAETVEWDLDAAPGDEARLLTIRTALPAGSRHLVCRDRSGATIDHELGTGWTRIGRSVAADLRFDDPSVSRRHALIVSEPGKPLRVLDDRSLNGVFLNGERVEWGRLSDGDELAIGCFHLRVLAP